MRNRLRLGTMSGMTRHALAFVPFLMLSSLLPSQAIEWWTKDFEAALTAAKDKPWPVLMVYCWKDGDEACASMFSGTLSDEKVQKAVADLLCMGAKDDELGKPVLKRYRIEKVPTMLFVAPSGEVIDVLPGYVPIEPFLKEVARIRADKNTIQSLRKQVVADPTQMNIQLQLMRKLRAAGDRDGAMKVVDVMIKADPKGKDPAVAEAMLARLTEKTFADGVAPADYDLGPLRRFLAKQRNKQILFLGYDRMAAAEYRRGDLKAAAGWAHKAWKNIPDDELVAWGQNIQWLAYQHWKDLDKADKGILKRALGVSKKTIQVIEKSKPDDTYLANAMWRHAGVLIVCKKRKEALSLMEEAIKLDPKNEDLKKAHAHWLAGNK